MYSEDSGRQFELFATATDNLGHERPWQFLAHRLFQSNDSNLVIGLLAFINAPPYGCSFG